MISNNLIIRTKLIPPTSSKGVLTRPALDNALKGTGTPKIVLVHAPAGYGKTTLLYQWFKSMLASEEPTCWLSLDELDDNPTSFLRYLLFSFRETIEDFWTDGSSWLDGRLQPDLTIALNHVINELVRIQRPGDFLFKPIDTSAPRSAINNVELDIKSVKSKGSEFAAVQDELAMKNKLLEEKTSELCEAQRESLICLAYAAEHKDATTGAHLNRISGYARRMGELLGWSDERCQSLALAAPLHDVGKIGIPDSLLLKKGRLTPSEYETMKRHTILGKEILSSSSSSVMRLGAKIALYHHEAFDGSGYPSGLRGNQIPIEAAIVSLVDVYDALRSSRPYKDSMAHAAAVDIICNGDDRTNVSQFHPDLLSTFLSHHREFDNIYHGFPATKVVAEDSRTEHHMSDDQLDSKASVEYLSVVTAEC